MFTSEYEIVRGLLNFMPLYVQRSLAQRITLKRIALLLFKIDIKLYNLELIGHKLHLVDFVDCNLLRGLLELIWQNGSCLGPYISLSLLLRLASLIDLNIAFFNQTHVLLHKRLPS